MANVALLVIGLAAGFISGLLGVGGGVILVPAILLVLGLPVQKAMGISLAVIAPTALMGAFRKYCQGNMDLKIALLIAVGGVTGALIGAFVSKNIPAANLRKIFGGFMILVGFNMLFGWTASLNKKFAAPDSPPEAAVEIIQED